MTCVLMFSYAKPPGYRSSGVSAPVGGCRWDFAREVGAELLALRNNTFSDPELPPAQQASIWGDLHRLMSKGCRAQLQFRGEKPEAKVMGRCEAIIELRPKQKSPGVVRFKRVARLYFAEPLAQGDVLLGLHLATKPGDRVDSDGEQNSAIDTAVGRAESWAVGHRIGYR